MTDKTRAANERLAAMANQRKQNGAAIKRALEGDGVDVNWVSRRFGASAFALLCANGASVELLEAFKAAGAELNSADKSDGETPLHYAVNENTPAHAEVVKWLVRNGADIEATNDDGETPLHLAASQGSAETAKVLVALGANVKASDKNGHVPAFLAQHEGHRCMVGLFASTVATATATSTTATSTTETAQVESTSHLDVNKLEENEGKEGKEEEVGGGADVEVVTETLQGEKVGVLQGHTSDICALVELPGGLLASCAKDSKAVRLWNTATMQCVQILVQQEPPNELWPLKDGRLATGSRKGILQLWHTQTDHCLTLRHAGAVWGLAEVDADVLVVGDSKDNVYVWNSHTGELLHKLGAEFGCNVVKLLGNGRVLVNNEVFDARNGKSVLELDVKGQALDITVVDIDVVAYAGAETNVEIWNTRTGQRLRELSGHRGDVNVLRVLRSGQLVSGGDDKTVRVWNWRTGECLHVLQGQSKAVFQLAELAHGLVVAANPACVWNVNTGQCERVLDSNEGDNLSNLRHLAALKDGSLAATCKSNIHIWR